MEKMKREARLLANLVNWMVIGYHMKCNTPKKGETTQLNSGKM